MSREDNTDYYDDGPDTSGLWMHSYYRAIHSKRGQAFLKEMKVALEAIPDHRLIAGSWCEESGVCALGAVAVKREVERTGQSWEEIKAMLIPQYGQGETADLRSSMRAAEQAFKLQHTISWELASANDAQKKEPSELRWLRMMSLIESLIVEEA